MYAIQKEWIQDAGNNVMMMKCSSVEKHALMTNKRLIKNAPPFAKIQHHVKNVKPTLTTLIGTTTVIVIEEVLSENLTKLTLAESAIKKSVPAPSFATGGHALSAIEMSETATMSSLIGIVTQQESAGRIVPMQIICTDDGLMK